ncbi:IclR family transcriptional regulator [Rhodococcus sp. PAMC28707]|nr:IclR family transcriptional regulator [Rhodococcus sp. PAMC28705]QCB61064.1 IclR family transcriptional regulator [Rhodococcus sp. PAMC28707]
MQTHGEPPSDQLSRAELMLDTLQTEGFLTLTQMVHATGIPRSSAHRLLERMVKLRWLLRVGDAYEIGVRMFELGSEGVRTHWFYRLVRPHLFELQQRTKLVVHLAYLDGGDVVYWEKLDGEFGAHIPTRIGSHQPAHRTALGKALLAAEPDEYLHAPVFDRMKPGLPLAIVTREQLAREITKVREDGIAFDRGEGLVDIGCVASSVSAGHATSSDGRHTVAAISICGPLDQMDARMVSSVRSASREISRSVGINPMSKA